MYELQFNSIQFNREAGHFPLFYAFSKYISYITLISRYFTVFYDILYEINVNFIKNIKISLKIVFTLLLRYFLRGSDTFKS